MPFDGNGNWTCNFSAVDDRDANIKIEASRFDNILLADIAQSFENCLTKDTQVKPTQNFNANNYRIINVANPSVGSDAVNLSTLNTKDGTAVHKSGTETITSSKTFMSTQYIGNSSITKGTAPASNTYYGLYFVDKNGTSWSDDQLGQIQMQCNANGDNVLNLNVIQQTAGSTNNAGIKVAIKQNGDTYTSAPTPTDTTSTSSSQIATVGWVNSTGNNVAHLSGTETITGNKTFSGNNTFSNTITGNISGNAGTVTNGVYTTGNQTIAGNKTLTGSASFSNSVSLGALATATAPSDTTSTSSTKVATTGWVNTVGNNVMHLTGNESVDGNKTFTSKLALNAGLDFNNSSQGYTTVKAQNSAINIGTAPSSNTGFQINLEDATAGINHRVGGFVTVYNTDGSTQSTIRAYKPDGSGGTNAAVSVTYPASGDPYASCPTPSSATDNSTKIATTSWVRNHRCTTKATTSSTASDDAPAYIVENYRNGTSWYRLYSDGWIEQGGSFSSSSVEQNKTVNLLKTMDNTNYFISIQRIRNAYDASITYSVVRSVSAGSFTCYGLEDSTRWEVKGYSAE